ncbi:MAG TPA: sulfatase-like hydrolase/transferase [Phycisphaerae bacterium]|nr:sulfatase-like hydrolase/transferase [Phycisphaerae bacterium]
MRDDVQEHGSRLSRRSFLARAAGVAAGGAALRDVAAAEGTARDRRPHILWIMTDEHRWDTIRAFGRHSWVRSPSLDRLAAEGVLFREAYCQSPLCVASRLSMLTGRYPHHTGVYGFEVSHPDTPFAVPFFPERMHRGGYTVASFGKEHHYRLASKDQPFTGGGRWYNLLSAFPSRDFHSWGRLDIQEARPSELVKGKDREKELGVLRRYLTAKQLILAGRNPVPADQTLTAHLTDRAIEYLRGEAPKDKPLLLRLSLIYPHTPVLPPEPFDGMYDPAAVPLPEFDERELGGFARQTQTAYENLRVHGMKPAELRKMRAHYYGLATYVDTQIGRMIEAFKAFCGARPWLIVFHPDHGTKLGEHGMHEKFTFYDESVHVPLIAASSDGRLPKGKVCGDFVELVDIAPTFLAAAGVELPSHLAGRDLADTAGGRVAPRTEAISEKLTYGRRAMLRTKRWSFEMQVGPEPVRGDRLRPEQMTWAASQPLEKLDVSLFDRVNDPAERHDLGRDPKHAGTCEELRRRLVARIFPEDRVEHPWHKDVPKLPSANKK